MSEPRPPIAWAVASRPLPGEATSGDLHVVQEFEGGVLLAAIDGLGHGEEATLAARVAAEELSRHAGEPVDRLLERAHLGLRATRGAVMTIASLDSCSEQLSWIAVGDVEAVRVRPGEVDREWVISRGGVVGYQLPRVRPTTVSLRGGDLLAFATDGIRDGFAERLDAQRSPDELAGMILARFGKATDDALVLVVRYVGVGNPDTACSGTFAPPVTHAELTASELDEEHEEHARLLGTLWRALAATPPALEVARRAVAELAEDLPGHTHREEGEVLPWLARWVPSCAGEIDDLAREHAPLVEGIHQLRVALRLEPDAARIAAALRLVEEFRRHVDRERQLTALAAEAARRGAG